MGRRSSSASARRAAVARARALNERAEGSREKADLARAEALARRSVLLFERHSGRDHPDVANVLNTLGTILRDRGRFALAQRAHTRAVSITTSLPARARTDEPLVARIEVQSYRHLGNTLRIRGIYGQADSAFRAALTLAEKHLGPTDVDTAWVLNDYAVLGKYTGQLRAAGERYRRALGILEAAHGRQSTKLATIHHNIGGLAYARGRHSEGEPHARLAVILRRRVLGTQHPIVMTDEVAWAALLDGLGKTKRAERIYRRALDVFASTLGREHPERAVACNNLAAIVAKRGDHSEARALYAQALVLKERALGRRHPELATTLNNLALAHAAAGNRVRAGALLRRALSILEPHQSTRRAAYRTCRHNLRALERYFSRMKR